MARALEDGELTHRRFESWLHLQRELRWIASRQDARLRAERTLERKRRVRDAGPARP